MLKSVLRKTKMLYMRRRYRLSNVHPTFYMNKPTKISRDLVAREYSFMGRGCSIWPGTTLGRYVMLAPNVSIVGGYHAFDKPGVPIIFAGRPDRPTDTVIEDDAWIGYGATIMSGVRVGRGAIVAAGSVVTRDIPPFEIHGGVPCKKIRDRFLDDAERRKHEEMLDGPTVSGAFVKTV